MRMVWHGAWTCGIVAVVVTAGTGCGASGDMARREDMLRKRQYELDRREARLQRAMKKFKQCMDDNYPGEDPGLEPPPPAVGGPSSGAGSTGAAAGTGGTALTPEQFEEIQTTERLGRPGLVDCYTRELERRGDKSFQGKVVIQIQIGTNGSARTVRIAQSTLKSPKVHKCIVETVRGWEFPALSAPTWHSTTLHFSPAY